MDKNSFKSNLKTLMEIVLDESRLVTYISLSRELCIHVNEAKLLLIKAVEDIRKKQPDVQLNVSYVISGLSDAFSGQTIVCTEDDLDKIKGTFKNIFFSHIYSLSKGSSSLDKVSLLATNNLDDLLLCKGLIKNNLCSKRSIDEIGTLKLDSQKTVNELSTKKPKEIITAKQICKPAQKAVEINGHHNNVKIDKANSVENIKTEIPSPKKNLFNNKPVNKNGTAKASKSIEVFFNKGKPASKPIEHKNKDKIDEPIKEETPEKEEKMDVDEILIENGKSKTTSRNKSTQKEVSDIKKNAKVNKNRKRLLQVSDSESDTENDPFINENPVNHESEDEIPPTPSVNTIKITSGLVNAKKRRKIVNKTYIDSEGYMLTRKEEINESGSETEEESQMKENVEIKKEANLETPNVEIERKTSPPAKKTKSKKKTPPKGNQPTMMNFFKKK